ncbi:hypothetical protein V1478_016779 [Vespula squamosa]|uniref:Uncharacterized protein n=1 Tax=Vespula squamosa TaxID=30214 RepID=A0ABD2A191_VESSQ
MQVFFSTLKGRVKGGGGGGGGGGGKVGGRGKKGEKEEEEEEKVRLEKDEKSAVRAWKMLILKALLKVQKLRDASVFQK